MKSRTSFLILSISAFIILFAATSYFVNYDAEKSLIDKEMVLMNNIISQKSLEINFFNEKIMDDVEFSLQDLIQTNSGDMFVINSRGEVISNQNHGVVDELNHIDVVDDTHEFTQLKFFQQFIINNVVDSHDKDSHVVDTHVENSNEFSSVHHTFDTTNHVYHHFTFDDGENINHVVLTELPMFDWMLVYKKTQQEMFVSDTSIASLRNTIVSIFTIMGSAMIVGIFYVTKRISKPLDMLIKSCNEIDPENLHPISIKSAEEFEGIQTSFNKLIGKIILNEQHLENLKEETINQKNEIKSKNIIISGELRHAKNKSSKLNQFRHALDNSSIVMMTDTNGTICHVNNRFCALSNYTRDELIGTNHRIFNSGYHTREFFYGMMNTISKGQVWRGDIQNKTKDGSLFWTDATITPMFGLDGSPETYIVIGNDITERKNHEEQIRIIQREIIKRKKELEIKNKVLDQELITISKLEKQKEEFTSMMTHEFKTPLTPILSWADLLSSEILGDLNEKQLKAISEININALKLLNLITDVLDVHKLELSKLTYNKTKCFSKDIVDELIENYSVVLNDNTINFVHSDIENISLYTDSSRIQQVLRIFITNALDFVPKQNGKIELTVHIKNDSILFSVIDNGVGISETDQKQLFRKFYQADTSATRKHGGSGLGLSVAKGIADGLGGHVGVISSPNNGSTFFVELPLHVQLVAQQ
ncbi:MAG: hypothetical protein COA77_10375 [Thaumarchaeota archaeon]|nr:MAG: hypothetical protein COA77_10375 [Nitrososphaerota archaeon]